MALLYPVSELDANQVLKYVFDEANQRLRVAAEIVAPLNMGDVEVHIDHQDDSVRLGDGTDYLTSTTFGSDVGLDVHLIASSNPVGTTPIIANVAMAVAGTEYLYSFSANTKQATIQARKGKIQFSYTVGTSGTLYMTLYAGGVYSFNNVNLSGVTLYFQSNKAADVLEINSFT